MTSRSSPAVTLNSLNSALPSNSYSARAGRFSPVSFSGSSSESELGSVAADPVSRCSVHAADVLIPASNSDCGRWKITLDAEGYLVDRGRVVMNTRTGSGNLQGILNVQWFDERSDARARVNWSPSSG